MKINYEALREGDIVLTTSLSWLAECIRAREVGPAYAFDTGIATHAGILVDIGATNGVRMLAIAEMLLDGLKINSLSDYLNKGFFGPRIVAICRHGAFDNPKTADAVTDRVLSWWQEGKKYDIPGLLQYVLPWLKNKSDRFYCSELVCYLVRHVAGMALINGKFSNTDEVTPWDIQQSQFLKRVQWRA